MASSPQGLSVAHVKGSPVEKHWSVCARLSGFRFDVLSCVCFENLDVFMVKIVSSGFCEILIRVSAYNPVTPHACQYRVAGLGCMGLRVCRRVFSNINLKVG